MIPKIIHYCWFGGKELPPNLKEFMKSWDILKENGYQIIRWDESNCSFDENEFVKKAYKEKKWGFIGDYYRLKAVYEYGGIYLDTDVIINKPFDDLLDNKAFIGFMHNYAICTAIFGAEKHSKFIKNLLDMYDKGLYDSRDSVLFNKEPIDEYKDGFKLPSNEYWTWNIIKNYHLKPGIEQHYDEVAIYPKTYFEGGSLTGNYYCRHINTGSWIDPSSVSLLLRFIRFLKRNEKIWILFAHRKQRLLEKSAKEYFNFK